IEELCHADFFPQNSCYFCHVFSVSASLACQLLAGCACYVWRGHPRPRTLRSLTPLDSRGRLSPHDLLVLFPECLDLNIHARGKIELHQRVHRLRRGIENIEQPLVRADLKLLPRFLVHVRRTQHRVLVLHRGQWNRPRDLRSRAPRGLDDLTRRLIEDAVVVGLQPYANFFVSDHFSFPDPFRLLRKERPCGMLLPRFFYLIISEIVPAPTVCPPSRMAKRNPFSIATGVISSISRLTLSPGITISVPAGSSATPVTSVVRR